MTECLGFGWGEVGKQHFASFLVVVVFATNPGLRSVATKERK